MQNVNPVSQITSCPAVLRTLLVLVWGIGLSGCQLRSPDPTARGREVFETCVPCHGVAGQGNSADGAPNIAGMSAWYVETELGKFRAGARGMQFDDTEGMRMRPMSLSLASDEDVKAVAAYVASLPPVRHPSILGGDPQAGRRRYALCSGCHAPDGSGNENVKAPRLAGIDDWYLATELKKFKGGIRGADPRDAEGQTMRPMANTLGNEKTIRDVVAYIETLKPRS